MLLLCILQTGRGVGGACFLETGEWTKVTEGHITVQAVLLPVARKFALDIEFDPNIIKMGSFSGFP